MYSLLHSLLCFTDTFLCQYNDSILLQHFIKSSNQYKSSNFFFKNVFLTILYFLPFHKSIGMNSHFPQGYNCVKLLLQISVKVKVLVPQSYLTLCDPTDYSIPGFVHGISQTRILEQVAISFSRESSPPRDGTQVSCTAGRFFTV